MGILIISIACMILGFLFAEFGYKWLNTLDEFFEGFGSAMFVCGLVTLIFVGITLIGKKADFRRYEYEYNSTKALVETVDLNNYGNVGPVLEKVISINDRIANHKAYSKTFWLGLWYSEKIGNLEPIKFDGQMPVNVE